MVHDRAEVDLRQEVGPREPERSSAKIAKVTTLVMMWAT